ncbi:CybS-domain-containing protein [Umbelopsis sp. AD052]|nr:CybS-domain-containing protein [Umbelopsis sp. AD052]
MSAAIRQHAVRGLMRARPMTISRIHTSMSHFSPAAVSQAGTTHVPDRVHGSYHWDVERAASAALVPLMAAQLAVGANPVTDVLLGVVLPVHLHIGFDGCITDYFPKHKTPVLNRLMTYTLTTATAGILLGCYQFNTHDVGITEFIARTWTA